MLGGSSAASTMAIRMDYNLARSQGVKYYPQGKEGPPSSKASVKMWVKLRALAAVLNRRG